MHKSFQRGQILFSFTFNATVFLLSAIAIATFVFEQKMPESHLRIHEFQTNPDSRPHVKFTPNVDFTSQYTPFLKQIFVYLKIVYGNKNEEIVWSKIIKRSDVKRLDSYFFNSYSFKYPALKDKVHFELRANYFPFVGYIKDKLVAKYVVR